MKLKEIGINIGSGLFVIGAWLASILGVVIHTWTVIMAWRIAGFFAAVITMIFPIFAEGYWFFKVGFNVGFLNNWYCIAIMTYVGLSIIGFAVLALIERDNM